MPLSPEGPADCHLVVLSPHLDDAVLSCGGLMAKAVAHGAVVVAVTVCAGEPEIGALNRPHVLAAHRRWGLSNSAVTERRAEDRRALESMGAHAVWAEVPDHLYWRYAGAWREDAGSVPSWQRIRWACNPFRHVSRHRRTRAIRRVVQACRTRWPAATVLAPLGIGGHPDHRQVYEASIGVSGPVGWYEDLPYAAAAQPMEPRGMSAHAVDITGYSESKATAIACYASQIGDLFGTVEQIRPMVERWSGTPASERVWLPSDGALPAFLR